MKIDAIFTTNIDDLPFRIFEGSQARYVNDVYTRGPRFHDRRAIDLYTLHGSVRDLHRPFRFTTLDIAAAFPSDSRRWQNFTNHLESQPVLFWGYSLKDFGTLQALSQHYNFSIEHEDKWIVLRSPSSATVAAMKALGFQIIQSDTADLLSFLIDFSESDRFKLNRMESLTSSRIVTGYELPEVGSGPVRDIIDFYRGSPPIWNDVYSGLLHRTFHFTKVKDIINSGSNCIMIGIPACGKTTLLMQLAAALGDGRHKIFVDLMTPEKARFIANKFKSNHAVVFIDNLSDSIESIAELSKNANIQIVAADRDYLFGVVAGWIRDTSFEIVNVTEIDPVDIQKCLDLVPGFIKPINNYILDDESLDLNHVSLFEVIESRLLGPNLRERYRSVLDQLKRIDEDARSLLVMLSYVQMCRTPVSVDMMISYLDLGPWGHIGVLAQLEQIGKLVSEYEGVLSDLHQDYFAPRSQIVGETVIEQVDSVSLRLMLEQFYERLSPYRIHRFDIFQTRAYRSKIMMKAFPKVNDGIEFYKKLFKFDPTAYVLQQAALYCSKKNNYREAFNFIEKSLAMGGGRKLAIKNSHAQILFYANLNDYEDPIATNGIQRSMTMLKECYDNDPRQEYHARNYSVQAINLWKVYGDERARSYLLTASNMVSEQIRKGSWDWHMRDLEPKLKRYLRSQF